MQDSQPSMDCQNMEPPGEEERPSRKRQRTAGNEIQLETDIDLPGNPKIISPAGRTSSMTAGEFEIPTIRRRDMDGSSASERNATSSSRTILVDDGHAITKAFEKYQAIYLPQYFTHPSTDKNPADNDKDSTNTSILQWKDLSGIFEALKQSDKDSFCIENETAAQSFGRNGSNDNNNENSTDEKDTGCSFLKEPSGSSANNKEDDHRVGYCSFMIQNDEKALDELLPKLPVQDPSRIITPGSNKSAQESDGDAATTAGERSEPGWEYEPCLWVFFGRNPRVEDGKELEGRPEHTDQISHDGTWHFQLSGTKRWLLRPTPQLLRSWNQQENNNNASSVPEQEQQGDANNSSNDNTTTNNNTPAAADQESSDSMEPKPMRIDCRQGDVLIVNTRLWRHQTIIPAQTEPSISYARDFWIRKDKANPQQHDAEAKPETGAMTNVDGLYAMDDIEEETIIFREDNMPDCELHRSSEAAKANCKVVTLNDGMQAVVSSKFIKAGEFFCIPDSDKEDSDDEDDEGWMDYGEETCVICR